MAHGRKRQEPAPEVPLQTARELADLVMTQMCSSFSVHRISRAERMRRMRVAQAIMDKIDANPTHAYLTPKEWLFVRQAMQAQLEAECDDDSVSPEH